MLSNLFARRRTAKPAHSASARQRFRPVLEVLEGRQLLSATPREVAHVLAHSEEHYRDFVTKAYQHYLGRAPESAGLTAWVSAMQNGVTQERLEAAFIGSVEYIHNHGGTGQAWVVGMYQDLLGRSPAAVEVQGWLQVLAAGTPTTAVAYGFAASRERESIRIREDYWTYLGRAASEAEVNYWVDRFLEGTTNEQVVAGFVGSPEYYNHPQKGRGSARQWIGQAYTDILHRPASGDEVAFWLRAMGENSFRGGVRK
jgi:hypothetical protein